MRFNLANRVLSTHEAKLFEDLFKNYCELKSKYRCLERELEKYDALKGSFFLEDEEKKNIVIFNFEQGEFKLLSAQGQTLRVIDLKPTEGVV